MFLLLKLNDEEQDVIVSSLNLYCFHKKEQNVLLQFPFNYLKRGKIGLRTEEMFLSISLITKKYCNNFFYNILTLS